MPLPPAYSCMTQGTPPAVCRLSDTSRLQGHRPKVADRGRAQVPRRYDAQAAARVPAPARLWKALRESDSDEVHNANTSQEESVMKRSVALLVASLAIAGASPAIAQESLSGPAPVVVTIIPAGGTFFTEGKNGSGPSFANYNLGAGVTFNFNRYVGVEGEVTGALGVSQNLDFAGTTANRTTPNILTYSGNVVVSAPNHSQLVPYVTGGVGGLSLFEKPEVGVIGTQSFLTGNVGGGVAWYAGRWGVRGGYRFIA